MCKIGPRSHWICRFFFIVALLFLIRDLSGPVASANPDDPGPCAVENRVVTINGTLETHLYFPDSGQCNTEIAAPYPGATLAHGFSMFGFSDGAADNEGHGEHLASWGYVVAIPKLPDDAEQRISDMQDVLSYLETETAASESFLYGKVDVDRFALAGHSFGGATVLALAAKDSRVKAVVALDPVYHEGGPTAGDEIWDHDVEGPKISAPTSILGAPSSNCNSEADYAEIYPFVGATHKTEFFIVGASHCDFSDPGNSLCSLVCDGDMDPARTQVIQKYMTAWFNYYIYYDTDAYTYLYGPEADQDVVNDLIQRKIDTAPKHVTATEQEKAVLMEWTLYPHPIVTGYNIYRRLAADTYPDSPQIYTGATDHHLDEGLSGSETYYYVMSSRDGAGNEHQLSAEVHATTLGQGPPDVTPTPLPDETPVPGSQDIKIYLPSILKNS